MFRKIIIAAVGIILVNAAYGQRFEGGLLAGYNATQVEGDSYKGYNKPGILGGFYVQTDLAPAIFAGMEIKYSQKGSRNRIKTEEGDEPDKYIMRLGYVDVPLFAGFRTSDRGSIVAGASFGYLIHAGEFDENGPFVEQDQNAFNNFDLQPFLGFQFDMLDNVKLDLRFAFSVLPIRGLPGEDATNYYWLNNQFNNVISLALYYRLDR
jgi:hypothetical protein